PSGELSRLPSNESESVGVQMALKIVVHVLPPHDRENKTVDAPDCERKTQGSAHSRRHPQGLRCAVSLRLVLTEELRRAVPASKGTASRLLLPGTRLCHCQNCGVARTVQCVHA